MIRKQLMKRGIEGDKYFRWRGGEVSRLEGLSDAVFAFAITLLVVSLEVPGSFSELLYAMKGFLAFGVTLTAVIGIWFSHYIFFRRYGFEDGYTVFLNALLLFVILFYIYPLKFLANLLINYIVLQRIMGFDMGMSNPMSSSQEWPELMTIYNIGFMAIFMIYVLLYLHAWRKRSKLQQKMNGEQ